MQSHSPLNMARRRIGNFPILHLSFISSKLWQFISLGSFQRFVVMSTGSTPRALILLVDENEDVEVVIPTYMFRYAGIDAIIAGVEGTEPVSCVKRLQITPDMSLEEARKSGPFDIVFLAGGIQGAPNLAKHKIVEEVLQEQEKSNGIVGAICYSPACSVSNFGIYKGRKITCYPEEKIKQIIFDKKNHTFVDEGIVQDGNLITAQGPAFAFGVSMAIIRKVCGEKKAEEVAEILLFPKKGQ